MESLTTINQKSYDNREDIKQMLKKVFFFYVSFGDRLNSTALKGNKLHKMMHDAYIIDENLTKKILDLLFCKHSKHKPSITFDQFLSLLVNIAAVKYPKVESRDAFLELFHSSIRPLYNNLYRETDIGEFDVHTKEPMDPELVTLLHGNIPVMTKIYRHYFDIEYQKYGAKETRQKSEKAIIQLLKDFDICPILMNVSTAYNLFQEIVDTHKSDLTYNPTCRFVLDRDEGKDFTLSKFLIFIARVALIGYSRTMMEHPEISTSS
jgi:hypothetical protein